MEFTFAHREEGFDTHIENSIRGYKDLLNDVVNFSKYFVEDNTAVVDFQMRDVRDYIFEDCSLVSSIFTLQFLSRKDRQDVVNEIYRGLNEGGAFIFAEKIDCENGRIQDMMTFNYYDFKSKNFGYKDIMNKERQLRHMLKPYTYNKLEEMLDRAGFTQIQRFWQNHLFVGVIAIK